MIVSGAGSAPARSRMARSLALCTVKLPEIWPGAAEDRLADHRRRDHLVVEHDGERLADVLLRRLREFARARGVEAERRRSARWCAGRSRAARRSDRRPRPSRASRSDKASSAALALVEDFGLPAAARPCSACSAGIDCVDHAEFELGGLAEQFLQPGRVLQARHLHQNAVGALALDQRLDGAELVDAALDDLDRLLDRLADALDDRPAR